MYDIFPANRKERRKEIYNNLFRKVYVDNHYDNFFYFNWVFLNSIISSSHIYISLGDITNLKFHVFDHKFTKYISLYLDKIVIKLQTSTDLKQLIVSCKELD